MLSLRRILSLFRKKESDKDFFSRIMKDADDFDVMHYGQCLRLARTGYYTVVYTRRDGGISAILRSIHDNSPILVEVIEASSYEESMGSLKTFMFRVYDFIELRDRDAFSRWIKQLRSSETAAQYVESKTRILTKE